MSNTDGKKYYVANYELQESLDAERDDPAVRNGLDLETFASPHVHDVSDQLSDEWVTALQGAVEEEYKEPRLSESKGLKWETDGWVEVDPSGLGRRPHQIWFLMDEDYSGEEIVAVLVVQRV